jgi:hypothetical protein
MFEIETLKILFLLLAGHALGDFSLQTEWVAMHKDRHSRLRMSAEERANALVIWPHLLTAHSLIHGGIVFMITGKLSLALAETAVHWITDYAKCERWFNFHVDQGIHVLTKLIWTALIAFQVPLF